MNAFVSVSSFDIRIVVVVIKVDVNVSSWVCAWIKVWDVGTIISHRGAIWNTDLLEDEALLEKGGLASAFTIATKARADGMIMGNCNCNCNFDGRITYSDIRHARRGVNLHIERWYTVPLWDECEAKLMSRNLFKNQLSDILFFWIINILWFCVLIDGCIIVYCFGWVVSSCMYGIIDIWLWDFDRQ